MSKERLREAIEYWDSWECSEPPVTGRGYDAIEMMAAAARAYACERCRGTGLEDPDDTDCDYAACPDCAEWRRIADGG